MEGEGNLAKTNEEKTSPTPSKCSLSSGKTIPKAMVSISPVSGSIVTIDEPAHNSILWVLVVEGGIMNPNDNKSSIGKLTALMMIFGILYLR